MSLPTETYGVYKVSKGKKKPQKYIMSDCGNIMAIATGDEMKINNTLCPKCWAEGRLVLLQFDGEKKREKKRDVEDDA